MKTKLKLFLIAAILTLGLGLISRPTFALEIPPAPADGFVLDNAEILSPEEETNLNNQILQIKNSTTNEIGILTLKDGEGVDPAQFAVEVGRSWGIGSKENKNGVLILITLQNPKYIQISTTTGLEGALTDAQSGQISRNEIAPKFRENKFYEGLSLGVSAIDSATKGEYTASSSGGRSIGKTSDSIFGALFFGFIILQGIFSLIAKTKSWWLGGVFGFIGSSLIGTLVHSLLLSLVLSLIFVPLGLALDYFVSKNYKKHKDKKKSDSNHIFPWYFGGGSGFGSGSSGGGFGGFGGGGSFGGGGGGSSW